MVIHVQELLYLTILLVDVVLKSAVILVKIRELILDHFSHIVILFRESYFGRALIKNQLVVLLRHSILRLDILLVPNEVGICCLL